jgi:hypothetical protein
MIDIEMLTALMKELGYIDGSDKDVEKKDHSKEKPESKPDQKEDCRDN